MYDVAFITLWFELHEFQHRGCEDATKSPREILPLVIDLGFPEQQNPQCLASTAQRHANLFKRHRETGLIPVHCLDAKFTP